MLLQRAASRSPLPLFGVRCMSRIGRQPVQLPVTVQISVRDYPSSDLLPIKPPTPQRLKYMQKHRPSRESFQSFGEPRIVRVDGPLGSLQVPVHSVCDVAVQEGEAEGERAVVVQPQCGGETKLGRTMWGTTRGYIANAVRGVSQGFRKELELHGVGFRARVEAAGDVKPALQGGVTKAASQPVAVVEKPLGMQRYGHAQGPQGPGPAPDPAVPPPGGGVLVLRIGFSHEVHVPFPPHLTITTPTPTTITIFGVDKQQVGQAAARIRLMRKPDAYKGKGIRYVGEQVKLRAGKRR